MKLTWPQTLSRFFHSADETLPPSWEVFWGSEATVPAIEPEVEKRFLAFRLEGETFAVPVEIVREVLRVPPVTPVPRGPEHLLGVMNLRGQVVPVYDIKPRLQLKRTPMTCDDVARAPRDARFVVLNDAEGDLCIWVDKVEDVVRLKGPAFAGASPEAGERAMIQGAGRDAGRFFVLLDVARVT